MCWHHHHNVLTCVSMLWLWWMFIMHPLQVSASAGPGERVSNLSSIAPGTCQNGGKWYSGTCFNTKQIMAGKGSHYKHKMVIGLSYYYIMGIPRQVRWKIYIETPACLLMLWLLDLPGPPFKIWDMEISIVKIRWSIKPCCHSNGTPYAYIETPLCWPSSYMILIIKHITLLFFCYLLPIWG